MARWKSMSAVLMTFAMVAFAAGCGGDSVTDASPEQVVTIVAHGIADGHPEIAWNALPESYRDDVTVLIHDAATKVDEEIWNESFRVIGKVAQLLEDKQSVLFELPMVKEQLPAQEEAEAGFAAILGIISALGSSELADLNALQSLDVEQFLAETGGDMIARLETAAALAPGEGWSSAVETLRATEATLVESSGETARLRIEAPGKDPIEEDWVKVEGKWIPEKMAASWDEKMDEARTQVEEMSEVVEDKPQVMMGLVFVETIVDQLAATETPEEFEAKVGNIVSMAMGMAMSGSASQPVAEPGMSVN